MQIKREREKKKDSKLCISELFGSVASCGLTYFCLITFDGQAEKGQVKVGAQLKVAHLSHAIQGGVRLPLLVGDGDSYFLDP